MKVTTKKSLSVELILTAEEALWLKSLIQNGPEDETLRCSALRQTLFNVLPSLEELRDVVRPPE